MATNTCVVHVSDVKMRKILFDIPLFTANDQCNNGICSSIGGSENNNGLPLHISIIIGIGACVFVLVCAVVIGAVYWRREEMNLRDRLFNPFASFSQRQVASEHIDSFSNPNSPTSTEAVVNLKIPPAVKL